MAQALNLSVHVPFHLYQGLFFINFLFDSWDYLLITNTCTDSHLQMFKLVIIIIIIIIIRIQKREIAKQMARKL